MCEFLCTYVSHLYAHVHKQFWLKSFISQRSSAKFRYGFPRSATQLGGKCSPAKKMAAAGYITIRVSSAPKAFARIMLVSSVCNAKQCRSVRRAFLVTSVTWQSWPAISHQMSTTLSPITQRPARFTSSTSSLRVSLEITGSASQPNQRSAVCWLWMLPQSRLSAWNEECAQTFPDDEIRKGDIIFLVNQIGPDQSPELTCSDKCSSMSAQLGSFDDLLILVQRDLA